MKKIYEIFIDEPFNILFPLVMISGLFFLSVLIWSTQEKEKTPYQECVIETLSWNKDAKDIDLLMSYCKELK